MKSKELRLKIELVPSTSWYNNLRKHTTKAVWDKIRKTVYAKYEHRCGICSTESRLNCHEIWEYDDKKHIQKLKGFIALCDMCHHVKHIGLAGILASEGKLDYEKVIEHFMKVNKCDITIFERHKKKAFEQWEKRSSHEWQVDLGEYDNIIKSGSKSSSNHGEKMKLKDAIELYKQEEKSPSNSYGWYRKSAQQCGRVSIGYTNVPTYKQGGIWYVDDKKFAEAIKLHREAIKHLKQVTADYAKGIIHGKNGDIIRTEWGGYEIHEDFRFVWSYYERYRKKSYGTWYCNKCNISAETEHNKEECHLCRNWNGCGEDCTLSRVYCPKCRASLSVQGWDNMAKNRELELPEDVELVKCAECEAEGFVSRSGKEFEGCNMVFTDEGKIICYHCQVPSKTTGGYWLSTLRNKGGNIQKALKVAENGSYLQTEKM